MHLQQRPAGAHQGNSWMNHVFPLLKVNYGKSRLLKFFAELKHLDPGTFIAFPEAAINNSIGGFNAKNFHGQSVSQPNKSMESFLPFYGSVLHICLQSWQKMVLPLSPCYVFPCWLSVVDWMLYVYKPLCSSLDLALESLWAALLQLRASLKNI